MRARCSVCEPAGGSNRRGARGRLSGQGADRREWRCAKSVGVGTRSSDGVRVINVDSDGATLEFDGGRHRLVIGQRAVHVSGAGAGGRSAERGHPGRQRRPVSYDGSINGAQVRFIVDTGATFVSSGAVMPSKAGIDFTKGEPA